MLLLLLACDGSGDSAPIKPDDSGTTLTGTTATAGSRVLGTPSLADGLAVIDGPGGGAGLGRASASCDLDGDGLAELLAGAPDADGKRGKVLVFLSPVSGAPSPDLSLRGDGEIDALGAGLACLGDRDGDGITDVGVGAPGHDEARGAAWLFSGSALLVAESGADAADSVHGLAPNDQMGLELGLAGDLDGDGDDELFVSAWLSDLGGTDAGALWAFDAVSGAVGTEAALAGWYGEASKDWAAYGVGAGHDLNADGFDDLLVGADGVDEGGEFSGAAYVLLGPAGGTRSLAAADAQLDGEVEDENGGHGVTMSADLTGDDEPDVVVGGFGYGDWAGRVAIFSGAPVGEKGLSAAAVVLAPSSPGAFYGYALAAPGDLDGDGLADLVVSARYDATAAESAGGAWIHYGPVGVPDTGRNAAFLLGEAADDEAGWALGALGDLDGDGLPEVGIGAPGSDRGGQGSGALYVWRGVP